MIWIGGLNKGFEYKKYVIDREDYQSYFLFKRFGFFYNAHSNRETNTYEGLLLKMENILKMINAEYHLSDNDKKIVSKIPFNSFIRVHVAIEMEVAFIFYQETEQNKDKSYKFIFFNLKNGLTYVEGNLGTFVAFEDRSLSISPFKTTSGIKYIFQFRTIDQEKNYQIINIYLNKEKAIFSPLPYSHSSFFLNKTNAYPYWKFLFNMGFLQKMKENDSDVQDLNGFCISKLSTKDGKKNVQIFYKHKDKKKRISVGTVPESAVGDSEFSKIGNFGYMFALNQKHKNGLSLLEREKNAENTKISKYTLYNKFGKSVCKVYSKY